MAVVSLVAISSSSPSARIVGGRKDDGVAGDAVDIARTRIAYESVGECPMSDIVAQAPGLRKRRARPAVAHQLDADEKTPSAHIADLIES